jgi:hypothetical protein
LKDNTNFTMNSNIAIESLSYSDRLSKEYDNIQKNLDESLNIKKGSRNNKLSLDLLNYYSTLDSNFSRKKKVSIILNKLFILNLFF